MQTIGLILTTIFLLFPNLALTEPSTQDNPLVTIISTYESRLVSLSKMDPNPDHWGYKDLFKVNGKIHAFGAWGDKIYVLMQKDTMVMQEFDHAGRLHKSTPVIAPGKLFDIAFDENGFWSIANDLLHFSKDSKTFKVDTKISVASNILITGIAYDAKQSIVYATAYNIVSKGYSLIAYKNGQKISSHNIAISADLRKTFWTIHYLGFDSQTENLWTILSDSYDHRSESKNFVFAELTTTGKLGKMMSPCDCDHGPMEVLSLSKE